MRSLNADTHQNPTIRVQKREPPRVLAPKTKAIYRDAQARALSNIDEARRIFGVNGAGAKIAVLDTGVRHTHQLFRPDCQQPVITVRRNVTKDNMGIADDVWDGAGHGTHISGLIAEVAPAAQVIAVKVLPSGRDAAADFEDVVNGLEWVVEYRSALNISVVCLALGDDANHQRWPDGNTSDEAMVIYEKARHLIEQLTRSNVPVVAAAGNHYARERQPGMCFPAILPSCISVGAVYSADRRAGRQYPNKNGELQLYDPPRAKQLMPTSARLPQ